MLKCVFTSILTAAIALLHMPSAQAQVLDAVAIMHQPEHNNMCAITFDDGPTAFTAQLLDSLREEGVPATFFLLGQQIRHRPELVLRMVAEGHEVASHGYSHPNMRKISQAARQQELENTNALLLELGIRPRYFRPPYGRYDAALAEQAQLLGMSLITWTTDSRDWKRRPADYRDLPTSTGRRMQPDEMRGVFLFHDTRQATVLDVKRIVADLRAGGCRRFVTVSEYFEELPTEEPIMAARPEVPADSQQSAPVLGPAGGASPASAPSQTAQAPEASGQSAASTQDVSSLPAGSTPVPMARSSSPWFLPTLFRSGG